jgi:hypothetical protein
MGEQDYPDWFLDRLDDVTGKRSRIVVDHILEHGHISTEELEKEYGYSHPPRAARDVREQGIPLETFYVKNSEGQRIGAYRFGDPSELRRDRTSGRQHFSKSFKKELLNRQGNKCAVCSRELASRYLQIDHRVPYEVGGESGTDDRDPDAYMLLCRSCNRAKSWSCEHCENWLKDHDPEACRSCYWGSPRSYTHIALTPARRLDVAWSGEGVSIYDKLRRDAQEKGLALPDYVKRVLRRFVESE